MCWVEQTVLGDNLNGPQAPNRPILWYAQQPIATLTV